MLNYQRVQVGLVMEYHCATPGHNPNRKPPRVTRTTSKKYDECPQLRTLHKQENPSNKAPPAYPLAN